MKTLVPFYMQLISHESRGRTKRVEKSVVGASDVAKWEITEYVFETYRLVQITVHGLTYFTRG